MGQSIVLSENKTEVPLESEDPAISGISYCSDIEDQIEKSFTDKTE